MSLNKYSSSIILKELSLRNFEDQKILFLDFPKFLELKIFFPINNFNIFKTFGLSSLIYSYFFCSFFFGTFNLKLSFSKKVFIKRRKKKIKRYLNGFFFFFF